MGIHFFTSFQDAKKIKEGMKVWEKVTICRCANEEGKPQWYLKIGATQFLRKDGFVR